MRETKLQKTLFILYEFHKRQDNTLDAYDQRLLDEIANELDSIELIKIRREKA